jgi:para-nitrobenzyl esterase
MIPPFSPVADGDLIPARPFSAIAAGAARGIPLIVGTNLEEMKLYRFLDPAIDALDEANLIARCSMLQPGEADGVSRGRRLAELYRAQQKTRGEAPSCAEAWLAISTDHVFRAAALKLAELQSAHAPVYVYELAWKATTAGKPQGAIHALELPFVFGTLDSTLGGIAGRTGAAHALSERMQDAWLAFARTGDPRTAGVDWPRYAPPRRATLELSERPVIREAPRDAERAIWDAVFE